MISKGMILGKKSRRFKRNQKPVKHTVVSTAKFHRFLQTLPKKGEISKAFPVLMDLSMTFLQFLEVRRTTALVNLLRNMHRSDRFELKNCFCNVESINLPKRSFQIISIESFFTTPSFKVGKVILSGTTVFNMLYSLIKQEFTRFSFSFPVPRHSTDWEFRIRNEELFKKCYFDSLPSSTMERRVAMVALATLEVCTIRISSNNANHLRIIPVTVIPTSWVLVNLFLGSFKNQHFLRIASVLLKCRIETFNTRFCTKGLDFYHLSYFIGASCRTFLVNNFFFEKPNYLIKALMTRCKSPTKYRNFTEYLRFFRDAEISEFEFYLHGIS